MADYRHYLTVLGGFRVVDAQGHEQRLSTRKSRSLAAFLALHPYKRFSRDVLAAMFWPEESERAARQSLRQALYLIRQAFGEAFLTSDLDGVSSHTKGVIVDAAEFEESLKDGSLLALETAERLYRGDLLDGHDTSEPPFDEWLGAERERLRHLACVGLARLVTQRVQDSQLLSAIATVKRLIAFDPFDEAAHRRLMCCYRQQGRRDLAIQHFQKLARTLKAELGVSPDQETSRLYGEICAAPFDHSMNLSLLQSAHVLEHVPQSVVVADLECRVVGWNALAEAEFGFSKDEIFGKTPSMLYAPRRDQSIAMRIHERILVDGRWSSSVDLITKHGRITRQVRTVTPLTNGAGEIIGSFGVGKVVEEIRPQGKLAAS